MKIKNKLHYAFIILISSVLILTGLIIVTITQNSISRKLDQELAQTSFLIYKIVKNVFDLNKRNLLSHLKVLEININQVYLDKNSMINSDAEHFTTRRTDYIKIPLLMINERQIFEDTELVDHVAKITGGNVSIFQLVPHGLLQISTNILRTDKTRATQIYIPADHKIVETIKQGKIYVDKGFEIDNWHIVAYQPLFFNEEVIGAMHVGIRPDIQDLRKHILDIKIGETGYPFIVDVEGILVIDQQAELENVYHLPHIKKMITDKKDGKVIYKETIEGKNKGKEVIFHYKYMPEMEWIVASGSYMHEFFGDLRIISRVIIISILVAIFIAVVMSLFVADTLTRPINFLTESMNQIKGIEYDFSDFNTVEIIKDRIRSVHITEDEIGIMTDTFYKMLNELEEAQKKLISRHRMYQEMEIARKIKSLLLPEIEQLQGYEISATIYPAEEAGGDYYDYSSGPNNQTWYAIGDVAGHGIVAGLIMMMAQSSINSIIKAIPDITPLELVKMVNELLVENIKKRMKMTHFMSLAILVSSIDGQFHYAGKHESFIIYRKRQKKCEVVTTQGIANAALTAEEKPFRNKSFALDPEDILVLFTDGLINAKNTAQELYGIEKVMLLIEQNSEAAPDQLLKIIMDDVKLYMNVQKKDITLFIIKKN